MPMLQVRVSDHMRILLVTLEIVSQQLLPGQAMSMFKTNGGINLLLDKLLDKILGNRRQTLGNSGIHKHDSHNLEFG